MGAKEEDVYLVMTHYNGGEFDHIFDTEEEAIKFAKLREITNKLNYKKDYKMSSIMNFLHRGGYTY